jgi:hypothetical protein
MIVPSLAAGIDDSHRPKIGGLSQADGRLGIELMGRRYVVDSCALLPRKLAASLGNDVVGRISD